MAPSFYDLLQAVSTLSFKPPERRSDPTDPPPPPPPRPTPHLPVAARFSRASAPDRTSQDRSVRAASLCTLASGSTLSPSDAALLREISVLLRSRWERGHREDDLDDAAASDPNYVSGDEPPSRTSIASGALRRTAVDVQPGRGGREQDYFNLSRTSDALASSKHDSAVSDTSLCRPGSSFADPSRRKDSRRISTDSGMTRRSSSSYSSSQLGSSADGRPPSMASVLSGDSYASTDSSYSSGFRLSFALSTFPAITETAPDTPEKRKRRAAPLDETASAMEGGKSLSTVLPESQQDVPQPKTLSELERECTFPQRSSSPSSSPSSNRGKYRHPFDGRPASAAPTPEISQPPDEPSEPVPEHGKAEQATDSERKLHGLQKRRRTIQELVETEATHAADMAVVRDIYLARARGVHVPQIASRVVSTSSDVTNVSSARPASPNLAPRRASHRPDMNRRVSSAPTVIGRADLSSLSIAALPDLMPDQPLMSPQDLRIVFANVEEIAAFAGTFANLLSNAAGSEDSDAMDDRIGEVFVEMIPRIEQVYSTYCVRHHRAIIRLQELEPSLRSYFSECKTLSQGRTNAWDLASLLIKPVQRCLKYPLLLDQILALTPDDHPDRSSLQRAYSAILVVAEHINECKKRSDAVARVVAKDKSSQRRESSRSISSSVTKKLLRSTQKAKTALGLADNEGDEMFDTLVALVDGTRSGVLRFSSEMRDWTESTKAALEAQVGLVEAWINLYAPLAGERSSHASTGHHRLCTFLDEVLMPIIEGPWRELDDEVRHSLIVKTDHLLSLFKNPCQVIAKRNDKMLDHSRYLAKKLPTDERGSEEFLLLSSQLLEDLPRFLGAVSRYFNIIVGHFARAQAAYHEAVQDHWLAFAEQWLVQIPAGSYEDIVAALGVAQQPLAHSMETLAGGLGIPASQSTATSPPARQRFLRNPQSSRPSSAPRSSRPRSSVASDSSASSSLRPSSTGSSGLSYSVYLPTDNGDEGVLAGADGPLYVAEAVNACRSSGYRSGYPIWSLEVGDRFTVELEEADSAEGGAGWLLCRKDGVGALGWARTEDLVMLETTEED